MKSLILLLSLTLFIGSCQQVALQQEPCVFEEDLLAQLEKKAANAEESEDENGSDTEEELPRVCVLPEKADGVDFKINATFTKFNEDEKVKMQDALKRLKIILDSEEFKQRIFAHTYKEELIFVNNNDLSNEEVYDSIVAGSETLQPGADNEIDLEIELYYSNKKVVGYTYPNVNKIWVNKKYFRTNSPGRIAANIAHEWTHKLGFGHDYKRTSRRPYSVPYGVGTIVQELVDGM